MGKPEKHVTIKEETGDVKEPPADGPVGPVPWDAEEDHLLSYFLEGDAAGSAAAVARHRSYGDAAAAAASHPAHSVTRDDDDDHHHNHNGTAPHSESMAHHHQGAPTTMTPAVHFYAPPARPNNTSLSSMASMAAALVGGPISSSSSSHHHHHHHHHQGSEEDHEDATISPAASMITNQSPENLMLPCGPQTDAEKQQHLLWLQHINAMAQMARQPSGGGGLAGYPSSVYPLYAATAATTTAPLPAAAASVAETEEKRARRLARNRESARQSRRRKKERLATLEDKVTSLFGELERQRRAKMMEMESQLEAVRREGLNALDDEDDKKTTTTTTVTREQLLHFLQETDCNAPVRQRVISFQLEKLRQLVLPRQDEFLAWLTLQPEDFFTAKKEQQRLNNTKTGRISSKQIGEELTSEFNKINADEDEKCSSNDWSEIWPLYCFELLVSVDQEERLVSAQKRIRQSPTIAEDRAKMKLATKMVELTKKGVLFQAHAASMRTHTTLLEILTPEQSVKFLKYMAANRPAARPSQTQTPDATLEDICKRLDQIGLN